LKLIIKKYALWFGHALHVTGRNRMADSDSLLRSDDRLAPLAAAVERTPCRIRATTPLLTMTGAIP
jgi:hypothetical protein